MARTFAENFETGPNGATLSPSTNTAYDAGSIGTGATRTFDAANAMSGAFAGKFTTGATAATSLLRRTFTSTSLRFFRVKVKFDAVGGGTLRRFKDIRSGSTVLARLQISTGGKLSAADGNISQWTSTANLTAFTPYRIEWMVNATTAKQRVRLFLGSNINGVTPDEDSGDLTYSGGAFDNHQDGVVTNASNWTVWVDEVANDDTDWVGPEPITGAGALTATPASLSGTGTLVDAGGGALTATPGVLSGTGSEVAAGAGALTAAPAALSGTGGSTVSGGGALVAEPATLAGVGSSTATGSGQLAATAGVVSGSGALQVGGSGALLASIATLAAEGALAIPGAGALVSQPGALSGSGQLAATGEGALVATVAALNGGGSLQLTGGGSLVAHAAILSAVGTIVAAEVRRLRLGGRGVTELRLGPTPVTRVCLGAVEVWS